jgi:LacI family transcriptional regulator
MVMKRVTIRHVAEEARVSRMTVMRVLHNKPDVSEETRRRITEIMQTLGYVPRAVSRVKPRDGKIVGLLIPDITTFYMGEILRGVSRAADQLNYGLMLYTQGTTDHAKRTSYYLAVFDNTLVDGVLLVVPYDYEAIVNDLKRHSLPYVIIDHHNDTGSEPAVAATNRKGALDAMRYLLALGHRRIGFITGRGDLICSRDRLQGYRDGLAEVGLPFDPALVREGDFSQPTGFRQGQALLELKDPPTAIFASNDVMAFGVMDAAKTAGLNIGQDISVVGFDDIYSASQSYPPLTTVHQPLATMGEAALQMLITLLEGRPCLTLRQEMPTELIIRGSTGRARQQ